MRSNKLSPKSRVRAISSVKWSDPGHFLKSQGKFFLSFHIQIIWKM